MPGYSATLRPVIRGGVTSGDAYAYPGYYTQVCKLPLYKQVTSAAEAGPLATRAEPNTVANKVANNMPERFIVTLLFDALFCGRRPNNSSAITVISETSVAGKCSMVSPACHGRKPIPFSQVSFSGF